MKPFILGAAWHMEDTPQQKSNVDLLPSLSSASKKLPSKEAPRGQKQAGESGAKQRCMCKGGPHEGLLMAVEPFRLSKVLAHRTKGLFRIGSVEAHVN